MPFPLLVLSSLVITALALGAALRTRRYFLCGMAGAGLLLGLHGHYLNYISDDGYIYFRYARNFADGHGPTYNAGGERVEGYMSILWLLALAAASKLGLNLPDTAKVLGLVLAIASLALLYPLARALPGGERYPLAPMLAGLALAAASPVALWTFAGMETPLLILLLILGVYLHLREDSSRPGPVPWSGIVFALAMMARPEAGLIAAVSGVFKLAALVDSGARRGRILRFCLWAAMVVLLYGAYFLWRYDYYGYLLPNTFYAKVSANRFSFDRGLSYLFDRGGETGGLLLAAALTVYVTQTRPLRPALYLAAVIAAWLAGVVFAGGDSLLAGRLIVPVLPFAFLGASLGGLRLLHSADGPARRPAVAASSVILAAVILTVLYPSTRNGVFSERWAVDARSYVGRWLADNVPPDTRIAVTPAGAIPYYSRLPAIDMLGLNDTHIAHTHVDAFGAGFAGHEKYDVDYVLEQRPQIIILGDGLGLQPLDSPEAYTSSYWPLADEYHLIRDERTFSQYQPVAISVRPGVWINLLVDREAADILDALSRDEALSQ